MILLGMTAMDADSALPPLVRTLAIFSQVQLLHLKLLHRAVVLVVAAGVVAAAAADFPAAVAVAAAAAAGSLKANYRHKKTQNRNSVFWVAALGLRQHVN